MDRPSTGTHVERRLTPWASSPRIGGRELLLAALGGVALAVLTSWPLAAHMSSRIAPDLGDPVRTAWEIAFVGHALVHNPLHLFNSNAFYPNPLSLAFSDSLLGYGPTALIGSGTVAALVRYNLLFLFAWSLCFVGAWLLARELGAGRIGAAAAGAAFAYAPYRITEAGHLHAISSGGIPLTLFLLLRGYRRSSRGLLAAGWLVAAWQMSLGFTLGLQFAYLMLVLALLGVLWWLRAHRPALPRDLLAISCIGIALCGAVTVFQARAYLKVAADYPTAQRTLEEVQKYSAGPWAFLAASSENRVWGSLTAGARAHVNSKNESVFFPGATILVLALVGAASGVYRRRLRIGLLCGIAVCSVLALGFGLTGGGWPYRLLYDIAPGWNGVRVPGRIFTLATLFLALLAGAGAQRLVCAARARSRRRGEGLRTGKPPHQAGSPNGGGSWSAPRRGAGSPRGPWSLRGAGSLQGASPRVAGSPRGPWSLRGEALPALVGIVLVIGLVGEGAGHMGHPVVPQPARAEAGLPAPILDLPADGAHDRIWQYFSTDGFPEIANGNSTFDIPSQDDLRGGMNGFPDRNSVEKLRWYGIRTVVLHLARWPLPPLHYSHPEPPDPVAAAAKPVAGLGITRRQVGDVVIYEIGPGPKALHPRGGA